jgi:hypothetical protein
VRTSENKIAGRRRRLFRRRWWRWRGGQTVRGLGPDLVGGQGRNLESGPTLGAELRPIQILGTTLGTVFHVSSLLLPYGFSVPTVVGHTHDFYSFELFDNDRIQHGFEYFPVNLVEEIAFRTAGNIKHLLLHY